MPSDSSSRYTPTDAKTSCGTNRGKRESGSRGITAHCPARGSARHAAERRLERLFLYGTLISQSGDTQVVPAPVYAVSWNAQFHGFAERLAVQGGERWMYIRGGATPLAQEQLAALGWTMAA